MFRPLLLGHRGARATRTIPENTLASFDLVLAHGCDGFEFDVRRTADGRVVICHDPEIHNIEIAKAGPGDLADLPELDQILARYQTSAFLDIELKVAGLEHSVLQSLRARPPQCGYVVSCFLPEVLRALLDLDGSLPIGLLCETQPQLAAWRNLPAQYVLPHHTLTSVDLCEQLHSEKRKVVPWTVNTRKDMLRFQEMGVDGIISDHTEVLAGLRG
ncbi:MAG TPA: glycerophosphodiester phosphodiesterase [Terriglobales bacterium]|nr:glycerophosphodiester phosphodiesterase [Terriglobales bacterium]